MPEGPEIKRAADRIAGAIAHQPITEVFFAFDHLKPYEAKLTYQTVVAVEPRGKALLIRFGNGLNIYSHNQLYGKWMVRKAHAYPDTNRQLRLALHTTRHSALLYSASDIEVLPDGELESHPFLSRIGPDVLSKSVNAETVRHRLQSQQFHRRQLALLLLDQQFLSGLGNYLRSEILFKAGVHPKRRPVDCASEEIQALAEAAIALPQRSYETGGITNDLSRAMQLKEAGKSWKQYRHYVFYRDGQPCFDCGTPIRKDSTGGRRVYYCPRCQPEP
ncbi:MAG: endonuclease VIII [Synechococcales bacterium]|nr:endonuclease VIII [Synechococcales bacterium]